MACHRTNISRTFEAYTQCIQAGYEFQYMISIQAGTYLHPTPNPEADLSASQVNLQCRAAVVATSDM